MKAKLLHQRRGERTFAVVLATGDEAVGRLTDFARTQRLNAAHLTGIGAFEALTLGFFDWETKQYRMIRVSEQVEVLSLVGDIALKDGTPSPHIHAVVGKADGTAHGGHLMEGQVRPTLEIVIVESPGHLHREYDPASRLALIRL